MNKDELVASLNSLENGLKKTRKDVDSVTTSKVYNSKIRESIKQLATSWFEDIEQPLQVYRIPDETVTKYHGLFTDLLQSSLSASVKSSYIKVIDQILLGFRQYILVPIIKSSGNVSSLNNLERILQNTSEQERNYLEEAVGCANHGYLRASVILAWSSAVHRMHKVVEKLGLDDFNKKSEEMKKLTDGRFKRFNKSFHIQSLSDLNATVFDNDLLWILEYWGLIDANQHERLSLCFTMRNNSAHPGEAPITEENIASFYSDLKRIIFDNPKFQLS
jgi:hypothetical protein